MNTNTQPHSASTLSVEYQAHRPDLDGELYLVKGQRLMPPVPFAALLAAAPELLSVLQMMVRAFNVPEIDPLIAFATIEKAKAVIAKAS